MVTDIKNIAFKYVKVSGGASTIDVTMDDARFYKNKPDGYYKCFVFPKKYFAGYHLEDLKSLVQLEKDSIWDETNRDTFLGYNEESNKFILNANAYMGLKDNRLNTAGAMPHPEQAGWHEMGVTTNQSLGFVKLKQTDGSYAYLEFSPLEDVSYIEYGYSGVACVEIGRKKVAGAEVQRTGHALWVKSPEDNSALMVYDNFPPINKVAGISLHNSGRLYSVYPYKNSNQTLIYGKPVIYFPDSGADQSTINISSQTSIYYIKNDTGVDHVELTETNDLSSILNSDESLTFMITFKDKNAFGHKLTYPNTRDPNKLETRFIGESKNPDNGGFTLSPYDFRGKAEINTIIKTQLLSYDPKNKPFIYIPNEECFNLDFYDLNMYASKVAKNFIKNIPDGFIFLFYGYNQTDKNIKIYRCKKGDPIKELSMGRDPYVLLEITGSTIFGGNTFYGDGTPIPKKSISKSDLINGTGFTDIDQDGTIKIYDYFTAVVYAI